MKRFLPLFLIILLLCGCSAPQPPAQIAATTLPVYEFTSRLCEGTGLSVTRLVTEEVSCLHDYSLNVRQVKAAEAAERIVISGAGLEEFMEDLLADTETIDASLGIDLLCPEEGHEHGHGHEHDHEGHHHDQDPHIWLSPAHARTMAQNICAGLAKAYPSHQTLLEENLSALLSDLDALQSYGEEQLSDLSCRELITFHDGFSYFALAFDLTVLEAVEEESGSEASARELIHLIEAVAHHQLPAVFTEKSGSVSAADIIARETGCGSFALDMAMAGDSYFEAMYHNIDTIKEALG
ncbi:MAG: zinc ABC transporter substrate-binding protein [Oscillospiraceae bacterium]|nr:zinc ABC transporter substrate-binding protein [Oscillospiraceae bacterium]